MTSDAVVAGKNTVGHTRAAILPQSWKGLATMLIGCLPSCHAAGAFAPLTLVLVRLAQVLAVGGQWDGATLLATESASSARRGLYRGIAQGRFVIGALLANVAVLEASGITTSESFVTHGWRIPFLFSGTLIGLGPLMHCRVERPKLSSVCNRPRPNTNAGIALYITFASSVALVCLTRLQETAVEKQLTLAATGRAVES